MTRKHYFISSLTGIVVLLLCVACLPVYPNVKIFKWETYTIFTGLFCLINLFILWKNKQSELYFYILPPILSFLTVTIINNTYIIGGSGLQRSFYDYLLDILLINILWSYLMPAFWFITSVSLFTYSILVKKITPIRIPFIVIGFVWMVYIVSRLF